MNDLTVSFDAVQNAQAEERPSQKLFVKMDWIIRLSRRRMASSRDTRMVSRSRSTLASQQVNLSLTLIVGLILIGAPNGSRFVDILIAGVF